MPGDGAVVADDLAEFCRREYPRLVAAQRTVLALRARFGRDEPAVPEVSDD